MTQTIRRVKNQNSTRLSCLVNSVGTTTWPGGLMSFFPYFLNNV